MTSPPRVALVDIDGTLVDSNDAHALAWSDVFREFHREVPHEQVRRAIGMGGDQLLPALLDLDSESDEGQAMGKRRAHLFEKRYLPSLRAFPGVRPLIERLRARGMVVLAATSARGSEVEALLRVADVADLVITGASADDVSSSKPAPDVVHRALSRAHAQPHEAVLLGDTPYDLESARRAGVRAVAVRCGGWDDASLSAAVAIYDDPADLLHHLDASPFGASG